MHPIQRMTTGTKVEKLAAQVDYGILGADEALQSPDLTPAEREHLAELIAG